MTGAVTTSADLTDRYQLNQGRIYLTGLQALVRLPLDARRSDQRAGLDTAAFISGYEGSPLAGYDLELHRNQALLDAHGIVFRPGLNEELAADAVCGSQLAATRRMRVAGVTGYWYGKAPGLDRATDALRHANLAGTDRSGGAVALVGDDANAKSSTVPSASEMALAELGMPTLCPSDPQEVLDLGRHAVALSRYSGLWVGFKIATNVADGAATCSVAPDRITVIAPELDIDGTVHRHQVTARFTQPVLGELERSMYGARLEIARRYAEANRLNTITGPRDARIGVVAAGSVYTETLQALNRLGLDAGQRQRRGIRLLQLGMVHPLITAELVEFAAGLTEIIVVEEKRAFIETALRSALYGRAGAPLISGKHDPSGEVLFPSSGDLPASAIADRLARRFLSYPDLAAEPIVHQCATAQPRRQLPALPLVSRTPFFCSGCPHNRSTRVPAGTLVGGGIGCSGLTALMPEQRFGDNIGLTQMGGEGAGWIGMAPFVEDTHLTQNMGDGTFHHSGSLAIRAAVAAGSNITYKLLYNSTVAMTGGQDAVGAMTIPQLTRMLLAEGVARVAVATDNTRSYRATNLPAGVGVHHRDELDTLQRNLASIAGVTVLIYDQECATELRRKRKRRLRVEPTTRVFINERVCEGCGDCGAKSNCLSVQPVDTDYGRKTRIHQASCNKDYSCVDGDCPSFIEVRVGKGRTRRCVDDIPRDPLPPPASVPTDAFTVRITGIGGTGVVTTAQVLGTAAGLAGRHVRTLDQTGMAQKGGAVVSDLKIGTQPIEESNRLSDGDCDLYLGCDLLVAASRANLAVADPDKTVAVVSLAEVPTGTMITDVSATFPDSADTVHAINGATRAEVSRLLDARQATLDLFDDDQFANTFLLGVAYQIGALPLPDDVIETAFDINGVAAQRNIQAFRRGRQSVSDPDAFARSCHALNSAAVPARDATRTAERIASTVQLKPDSPLRAVILDRTTELIAYQNPRYATQYADFVERVRRIEARTTSSSMELTETVARNLFKLMAYKDEYEVARLSIDTKLAERIRSEFGPNATYAFKLHPPLLRAMGMRNKIKLGQWFRPVFVLLYALRHLRGTPIDIFGYARLRKIERRLIAEYRTMIDAALVKMNPANYAAILELAGLPDIIRGYENVKLGNIATYRKRAAELNGRIADPVAA